MEEDFKEIKKEKKHKGIKRPIIAIALAAIIAVCGSVSKYQRISNQLIMNNEH